jgi:hypothetical protein
MAAALNVTSHANLARPRLDSGEHDVILVERRDLRNSTAFLMVATKQLIRFLRSIV